jgi:CubicO group peptidase (beta-lactamase class C family)
MITPTHGTTRRPQRPLVEYAVACLIAIHAGSACPASEPADARAALEGVRARLGAPAIAGAVVRDGQLAALGVCGVRSGAGSEPATLDDRWPVGSCTKPMTRFVIARLAERGVIRLDATIGELFDGVPMREAYKRATLNDVLAHRAGIQPYTRIGPRITPELFELTGAPREQRAAFAAHVLAEESVAEPGTRAAYSNAGYGIAAAALERKTGKAWEELVQTELFDPLGMASAAIGPKAASERVPTGHLREEGRYRPAPQAWSTLDPLTPAGGVATGIADFAKFAAAQADLEAGRAVAGISADTARQIAAGGGKSWPVGPLFGGDGRYTAAFAVWPKERAAIVVASNAGESDDLCSAAIEALRAAYAPELSSTGHVAAPRGPADGPRFGFGIKNENGTMSISEVVPGSVAEKGGLQAGDVVVAVDGRPAAEIQEADWAEIGRWPRVKLTVERGGQRLEIALSKGD